MAKKDAKAFMKELTESVNAANKGSLMLLPGKAKGLTEGLSTGSLNLNEALSGNPKIGFAKGRIIEIYGPEMSGKTTLCLHAVAEAQKLGWPAVYVDAEHAVDKAYAEKIGVDFATMALSQPDCGEDALALVERVIKEGCPLVVVDSVAMLTPRAELDGEMGQSHMGLLARLMSQAMRKLVPVVEKHNAVLIFINQIRMKIGVMFGNPETTPGGHALRFASSYRLEIRSPRGGAKSEKTLTSGTVETGIMTNVKVVKNKLYPPLKKASIPVRYGYGFDRDSDLLDYLDRKGCFVVPPKAKLKTKKLKVKDKWYSKNTLLTAMREDATLYAEVYKHVNDG